MCPSFIFGGMVEGELTPNSPAQPGGAHWLFSRRVDTSREGRKWAEGGWYQPPYQ